jgi:hypothetical protein
MTTIPFHPPPNLPPERGRLNFYVNPFPLQGKGTGDGVKFETTRCKVPDSIT